MSIYEELLKIFLTKCECRIISRFNIPAHLNVDFKKALISAAKTIFDSNLTIRGCFNSLCQHFYRKVQDLGLINMVKNNDEFGNFYMECWTSPLVFLPFEHVFEGMELLVGTKFKLQKIGPLIGLISSLRTFLSRLFFPRIV